MLILEKNQKINIIFKKFLLLLHVYNKNWEGKNPY